MIYKETNAAKTAKGQAYESPSLSVVETVTEGVLCASGPWYRNGGTGNFNYDTEDDLSWD
ncbi:MAG: hypothetical protein IJX11_03425 [Bacteroidales bacterium]|nr:hypothetical protein [Bacteroidales bacterium]